MEMSADREEKITLNKNRSLIYAFLSRMYEKEITVELLKELSSDNSPIFQIGASVEIDDPGFKKGFEMLGTYLRSVKGRDPNKVKLELAVEYANLFLGLTKKPAHPSESVYMSGEHTMYQEPRDNVMKEYWKAGLDRVKEFKEPEDHIAIELKFMEYLCGKTAESLEKNENEEAKVYLNNQKAFVNDHLSRWVPQFTTDILQSGEIDFYRGVACITKSFIELEGNAITLLLGQTV
jgi:TorA maturation chaperone TorD